MIFVKNNLQSIVWGAFAVSLYAIAEYIFSFPMVVHCVIRASLLFIFYRGVTKYAPRKSIDSVGYKLVVCFVGWLLLGFFRACTVAEGYWVWKHVMLTLFLTPFYIIIFLASNPSWLQGVYRLFWRYYLPLVIIGFVFFRNPNVLNYLPYSTLLLFWGVIPKSKRLLLLVIVGVFFVFQEQRNDLIKMIVGTTFGVFIFQYRRLIPKWTIKVVHLFLLIMPVVLLFLATLGVFNIFNMDEYIDRDLTRNTKQISTGKEHEDNLKADTRTFLYENVFYTMDKYDAWIIGRSPAYSDEGLTWIESGRDEVTGLVGRYGNEVQILNLLLWYGVVSVILYFVLYIRASYLAIYCSRSIFMKIVGLYIAFLWMWAFVWEVSIFATFFMFNILFLGVGFSEKFREMSDQDFQLWAKGIFSKH